MKVNIVFEDEFTLEQELRWEFKHTNKRIGADGFQKIILESFNEAARFYMLQSTYPFSGSSVEIRVLMRSPEKSNILAYFDLSKIAENARNFYFKLYADALLPLIKTGNIDQLINIWIHEIMHMVDYRELLRNISLYRKREIISNRLFYIAKQGLRKDKHIIFLQMIMQFRSEGIATLLQYISGNKVEIVPVEEASRAFSEVCHSAFLLSDVPDMMARQIGIFFDGSVIPLSYLIGAGVVLKGLIKKHPEDREFKEAERTLARGTTFNTLVTIDAIGKIRDFSSFDFINYCFDHDSVYRNIYNLSSGYSDNLEICKDFFPTLHRLAAHRDKQGFVWFMKEVLGSQMTKEEISNAYMAEKSAGRMPGELLRKADFLYKSFLENKDNEVAVWTLTYLYDDVDLLDDDLEYFGLIDDLAVVNTALILLSG
jgi:hypothetical protein